MINYYDFFGIETDATIEQIKKAYKEKLIKYHPDNYYSSEQEKNEAIEKLEISKTAYNILTNDKLRKQYNDKLRKQYNEENNKLRKQYKKTNSKENLNYEEINNKIEKINLEIDDLEEYKLQVSFKNREQLNLFKKNMYNDLNYKEAIDFIYKMRTSILAKTFMTKKQFEKLSQSEKYVKSKEEELTKLEKKLDLKIRSIEKLIMEKIKERNILLNIINESKLYENDLYKKK